MPLAYECPECRRAWPYTKAFGICPECRVTCRSATAVPMTGESAKVELGRVKFNRWYQDREAKRVGPSPEELGRQEAGAIIEAERVAHAAFGDSVCGKCRKPCRPIICEFREPVCDDCWDAMSNGTVRDE